MVLPIKNRKRPNWAVGFISWGLPVLWGCSPKNSTSCRIVKAFLVMPVIVRNDDASPWWYNFAHGDSSGKSTAQRCSFVRFRTELLAWTSTTNRQKYNTRFRVLTSIGWLPSVRTQTKKWRVFFQIYTQIYNLYAYKHARSFGTQRRINLYKNYIFLYVKIYKLVYTSFGRHPLCRINYIVLYGRTFDINY